MSLEGSLLWVAGAIDLLATGLAAGQLLKPRPNGERWVMGALAVALVPHAASFVVRAIDISSFPIASVHDGVSAPDVIWTQPMRTH